MATSLKSLTQTNISAVSSTGSTTLSGDLTVTGNIVANGQTIDPANLGYLTGVSSDIQTQIDAKADKSNTYTKTEVDTVVGSATPSFSTLSGKPTSIAGYGIADAYTKTETDSAIQAVVGAAPAALDTLKEIADQLANDESAVSALTTTVSTKADQATTYTKTEVDAAIGASTPSFSTLTGKPSTVSGYGITDAYTKTETDSAISASTPSFSTLTGKPTTVSGYGITDAYTKTEIDSTVATIEGSLSNKAPINNPTFTGTVGGINKTMVGLGNIDNTSDVNKPVSTAQQTALDLKANQLTTYTKTEVDSLKANIASPTFTGAPLAPTATAGTNTTQVATTAFVSTALTTLSATNLTSGTVGTARLGTGTANSTTYLRGDGTWAAAGGGNLTVDDATNSSYFLGMATTSTGGVARSSNKLYFNPSTGTLNATNFNSLSDITMKTDIAGIDSALNVINQLNGYTFKYIESGQASSGVIAQEIEQILPFLVETNEDGIKTVNYIGIIAYLIEAIKEISK